MIRQCAWCGKIFGEVPPLEDYSVTHCMCVQCYRESVTPRPAPPSDVERAPIPEEKASCDVRPMAELTGSQNHMPSR